jgi:hypothetical protein
VYLLGTGESVETSMVSQMADFTPSRAFPVAGPKAFAEAGTTHNDVDHLMIYGAPCSLPGASFAHPPIYGLSGSLPPGAVLCPAMGGSGLAARHKPRSSYMPVLPNTGTRARVADCALRAQAN